MGGTPYSDHEHVILDRIFFSLDSQLNYTKKKKNKTKQNKIKEMLHYRVIHKVEENCNIFHICTLNFAKLTL